MPIVYEAIGIHWGIPIQFLEINPTKWRREHDEEPTIMLREADDVYQAAPEMLEALKEIAAWVCTDWVCSDDIEAIRSLAKAAISKTQGG